MAQRFWKIVAWVTFPGFMYSVVDQKWDELIPPLRDQKKVWTGLGMSIAALSVYFIVMFFGEGILAAIGVVVFIINSYITLLCIFSLALGTWSAD